MKEWLVANEYDTEAIVHGLHGNESSNMCDFLCEISEAGTFTRATVFEIKVLKAKTTESEEQPLNASAEDGDKEVKNTEESWNHFSLSKSSRPKMQ